MVLRKSIKRRRRVINSKRRKNKIKSRKIGGRRKIIMRGGIKIGDPEVTSYEGTYTDDDLPHGEGTLTYTNGNVYKGEWMNGLKHGNGIMTYNNETKRTDNGIWENDELKSGKRVEVYIPSIDKSTVSGYEYEGTFKNNEPDGHGKIKTVDYEYEGGIDRGLPHGKGKLTRKNYTYDGEFEDGELSGKASQVSIDGNIRYDGTWKNGSKQNGTLIQVKTNADGSTTQTVTKYIDGIKRDPVVQTITG